MSLLPFVTRTAAGDSEIPRWRTTFRGFRSLVRSNERGEPMQISRLESAGKTWSAIFANMRESDRFLGASSTGIFFPSPVVPELSFWRRSKDADSPARAKWAKTRAQSARTPIKLASLR
jgi:hypothetical protein